MKYFYHKCMERVRIAEPVNDLVEMHRNVRVELYSQEIAEKIKNDIDFTKLSHYPDIGPLIDKLASSHSIKSENILITSGIDSGIKTIFEMCTKPSSNVVCLYPTYAMYKVYADAYDVNIINVISKQDYTIDIDDLLNSLNTDVDVVFIPNPHIPVEYTFDEPQIKTIIEKAQEKGILVVIDEAYYMFGAPTMIPLIREYNNLVIARTFSKGFGLPSIRLGYLMANEELISYLSSRRFAHETNYLTIQIANWAIDHIDIFKNYNNEVIEAREWLKEELKGIGFDVHGSQSNSLLLHCKTVPNSIKIALELKEAGYMVKSNIPKPFDDCLLITIGNINTMAIFYNKLVAILKKEGIL